MDLLFEEGAEGGFNFFSTFFSPQFNSCRGVKEATLFNKTGLDVYETDSS